MSVSAPVKSSPTRKREKLYIDVPFTKAAATIDAKTGDLILNGYASTWTLDRDKEMVAPSAFDGSLEDYLTKNPIVLWQHDMKCPIGQVTAAKADATGLYVTVVIPDPGPNAADWQKGAYSSIKMGIVKTFSIGGYFTRDVEMGPEGPVFTIVDAELFEISTVSIPANADSIYGAVMKSFNGEPPALSPKATEQMEQLIGFVPIADPELLVMAEPEREERYKLLSDLFRAAHDGAEPPALGTWTKVKAAEQEGASPVKVLQAKLLVTRSFFEPKPDDAKAGRSISSANATKLQSALDAHKSIEDCMINAAEQMKSAASYHSTAVEHIQDVMGVKPEDEPESSSGTEDEDEQADEPPNTPPKKSLADEIREAQIEVEQKTAATYKQLQSDLNLRLREAGQERFASLSPGPPYTYSYVDDVDIDRNLVYYCVWDGDDDDWYEVPFMRGADGSVTLGDEATEVQPSRGYVPKGLDFLDTKGVLSVPSAAFAPRDTAWDGSAARGRIKDWSGADDAPNAKYKQAFLWQDGDGSTFGDLKYPVCDVVDGDLKCVLKAVSAAASRANTNNLDALKPPLTTLYNRAAKQFDDEEIEAPWAADSDD